MTARNAIEAEGLTKRYGALTALDGATFGVARGELFGLIGPDGAGKTTLFRLLTTLINPDGGTASIDGCDIVRDYREIRKRVGYMPGRFSLYPDLSVAENLDFFAALFGVSAEASRDLIAPIYRQIPAPGWCRLPTLPAKSPHFLYRSSRLYPPDDFSSRLSHPGYAVRSRPDRMPCGTLRPTVHFLSEAGASA